MPTNEVYIKFFAEVNQNSSNQLMNAIDQQIAQGVNKITLLISTPGGLVFHGLSIHNYLMGLPVTVETHNFGSVDSIGVTIFSAGARRYSVPDARFLLHPISFNVSGNFEVEKIEEFIKSLSIDRNNIASTIAKAVNIDKEEIIKKIFERTTLNPEEAKKFGLVHEIKKELFPKGALVISINMS